MEGPRILRVIHHTHLSYGRSVVRASSRPSLGPFHEPSGVPLLVMNPRGTATTTTTVAQLRPLVVPGTATSKLAPGTWTSEVTQSRRKGTVRSKLPMFPAHGER